MAISNTGLTGSLIEDARTRFKRHLIAGSYGPLTSLPDAAVIGQMLKSTDVYTPTTSPLAALDMKKRLADMRSTGVI